MATFTYLPDYGARVTREPRIKTVQFGDGYEQRQADGINANPEKWDVSFSNRDQTETNAIDDFLIARGGVENFDWVPPRQSVAKKFVCKSWQRTPVSGNIDTITATFIQVYEAA